MRSSTLVVRRVKYAVDLDFVHCSLHFCSWYSDISQTLALSWQNLPIYMPQHLTLKQVCQTSRRPWIIDQIPEKNIPNKCLFSFWWRRSSWLKSKMKSEKQAMDPENNDEYNKASRGVWAVTTQSEMLCFSCLNGHAVKIFTLRGGLKNFLWLKRTFATWP